MLKKLNQKILMIIPFLFFVSVLNACHSEKSVRTSHKTAQSPREKMVSPLYFNLGEDKITDMNLIARNASWLKANSGTILLLEGHCDDRGSADYNIELGDKRARAVMKELLALGVSENQIVVVSYGKNHPATTEKTEEAKSKNRRVEFVVR
ncbi:MAG: hypothetical protein A2048_02920 [Deltaproteobacteria bacterium GWA2_45_12]|nr:MAG: hypothetical protein A2048_02920 [Deltaproteobacteria bacterium GWA2_45_12]